MWSVVSIVCIKTVISQQFICVVGYLFLVKCCIDPYLLAFLICVPKCWYFWISNSSYIAAHLIVLLVGTTSSKKHKAMSFQIGSG